MSDENTFEPAEIKRRGGDEEADAKDGAQNAEGAEDEKQDEAQKKQDNDRLEKLITSKTLQERKKAARKRTIKQGAALAVLSLFTYLGYWLFAPFEAGMAYGICKVFLEQQVRYPHTLKIGDFERPGNAIRIWFSQTDSFCEYKMEPIQCYLRADDNLGFVLDRVTIRRREIDPGIIEAFNRSIPTIRAYPPSLVVPYDIEDRLQGLQFKTDEFRKPVL